jgi:hypothetical protein
MDDHDFHDPADSVHASYIDDPINKIEPMEAPGEPPSKLALRLAKELDGVTDESERIRIIHAATRSLRPIDQYAAKLRELLVRIIESDDPSLECKIVCAAVGLPLQEETLAEIGVKSGRGRAAISKRMRGYQDRYGIAASGYGKRASSRETYRKQNARRRKKPEFLAETN